MTNLWIFGDSFSVGRQDINKGQDIPYKLWYEEVATDLKCEYYHNYSQWGVSNEYIINEFMYRRSDYKNGDYIIIQLTDPYRQWFFHDKPELGNIHVKDMKKWISKDQYSAIQAYLKYLDNDPVKLMKYTLYCMALEFQAKHDLSHCRILILPGFHPIPTVLGTLLDICNDEFIDESTMKLWYDKNTIDPRPNHLSSNNHKILSEKISHYFLNGGALDLCNGFLKGFL